MISILYHDVVRPGALDSSGLLLPGANRYKLDSDEFDRHLKAIGSMIRKNPVTLKEFPVNVQDLQLLITFDDGGASFHSLIADRLESYGWRGHFFITTDFIDAPRFVSRRQILDLRQRGHVIGSHSCSHPPQMSRCSSSQLNSEWRHSVRKLEDIVGEAIKIASIPGGFYSVRVAEAASAAGIRALFTSDPTTKCRWVGNLVVLGRYTIQRGMAPHTAASLASGRWQQRVRQSTCWRAKSLLKSIGGRYYNEIRAKFLGLFRI